MQNHHRSLVWHTLRALGTFGSKNHKDACEALILTIPWNEWSNQESSTSDKVLECAVRAIASDERKPLENFNTRFQSAYRDIVTDNLQTMQYYVASWASRETLVKYLEKE